MTKVNLRGRECEVQMSRYCEGDRLAIRLISVEDGMPEAVATINVPGIKLAEDEVLLKDYSEGTAVVDALVEAGVVELAKPRRACKVSSFVTTQVYKVLVEVPQCG